MNALLFPHVSQVPELSFALGLLHVKQARISAPELSYGLGGRLYLSRSGWLLLSVPNNLLRGAFAAIQEPGAELPWHSDGTLNAHITVMRPEELEQIGGPDKVSERGQIFRYTLGPLQSVEPHGWSGMSRVWMIKVQSPALKRLRVSYGLSPLPKDNQFEFHITVAVRRRGVLQAAGPAKN